MTDKSKDPFLYSDIWENKWKTEFIKKFGAREWAMIQRRKSQIMELHIAKLTEKYLTTGNKKYLAILKKYGVDVDYDVAEDAHA